MGKSAITPTSAPTRSRRIPSPTARSPKPTWAPPPLSSGGERGSEGLAHVRQQRRREQLTFGRGLGVEHLARAPVLQGGGGLGDEEEIEEGAGAPPGDRRERRAERAA